MFILAGTLANLILGAFVVIDSPSRKVNRLFCGLCVMLSLSQASFVVYNMAATTSLLQISTLTYLTSILLTPTLFFHLVIGSLGTITKREENRTVVVNYRLIQLFYVLSVGVIGMTFYSSRMIEFIHGKNFSFPNVGQEFWLSSLVYTGLSAYSVYVLMKESTRVKDPSQKSRLVYMMIGSVTLIVGGYFNLFLINKIPLYLEWTIPFGFILSTGCMAFIAYALTSSQLYHFTELFRKSLAILAMTLILLLVFGGTHLLSQKLLNQYFPDSDFFALAVASIVMSLLFHPLRYQVQNLVDRFFFSRRYDQMQRLRGLSRRVLSSADREELMNILFTSLQSIGFSSITLLLKDPQKPIFHIKKRIGLQSNAEGFFLRSDSLLIQYVREEKQELIRDEVTRRLMADWERQTLSDEMSILQSEIIFPVFSSRRRSLFGVITLGNSELGYSSYKGRNIFWLKSVIDNAGIMLDNFYHQEFANALVPYVGKTWADEMRRNKEGFRERLSGHRTWVSVVMVDIRHFTNMSAKMDPVEVVGLLKDFRLKVAPVVYRFQGTIDKFIGDAIMIVFGLPILPPIPNPDLNAAECAREIMKEIQLMNEQRFAKGHKTRVSIGIGVSSGEVIAGNVDSGDRVEYTVIGDAANMVARLEDMAGDNQILISQATYLKVKDKIPVKPWAPRQVQGFDGPVTVYELLLNQEEIVTTDSTNSSSTAIPAPDASPSKIAANQ